MQLALSSCRDSKISWKLAEKKRPPEKRFSESHRYQGFGASERNRTADLFITSDVLYLLCVLRRHWYHYVCKHSLSVELGFFSPFYPFFENFASNLQKTYRKCKFEKNKGAIPFYNIILILICHQSLSCCTILVARSASIYASLNTSMNDSIRMVTLFIGSSSQLLCAVSARLKKTLFEKMPFNLLLISVVL